MCPSQKALVGLIPAGEGMEVLNSLPAAFPVVLLHQSPPRRYPMISSPLRRYEEGTKNVLLRLMRQTPMRKVELSMTTRVFRHFDEERLFSRSEMSIEQHTT